jgi:hypothetical protein
MPGGNGFDLFNSQYNSVNWRNSALVLGGAALVAKIASPAAKISTGLAFNYLKAAASDFPFLVETERSRRQRADVSLGRTGVPIRSRRNQTP